MAPPAKYIGQQVLEAARDRIRAIAPTSNIDYFDSFDFCEIVEPPPEQYIRNAGIEVPSSIRRMAFVWCADEPVEPRDSGRNQATLALVVSAMQRYPFDDKNPYAQKPQGFKSRYEIRNEMKSDLILAFKDIRLGGVSVFAEHVDSRNIQEIASTLNDDRPWILCELLFDVVFKYMRKAPWKTNAA